MQTAVTILPSLPIPMVMFWESANLQSMILNLKVFQRKRLPGAPAWSLFKGQIGNSNQLATLAGR